MGPAERMGYDQSYARIEKVRYSHDAMIDQIVANPMVSQNELAQVFGYTPAWVSRVIGSDAFQARLAERKAELIDPHIVASIEERLKALASYSIDKVLEKLEQNPKMEHLLKAAELSTRALGYGAKKENVAIQQNFVAVLPARSETSGAWLEQYRPGMPQLGAELAALVEREPEKVELTKETLEEALVEAYGGHASVASHSNPATEPSEPGVAE